MPIDIVTKNGAGAPPDTTLRRGEMALDLNAVPPNLYTSTDGTNVVPVSSVAFGGGGAGIVGRFPPAFTVSGTGANRITDNNPSAGFLRFSEATSTSVNFNGSFTVTPTIGTELVMGLGREDILSAGNANTIDFSYSFQNAFGETFASGSGNLSGLAGRTEPIYPASGTEDAPVFLSMGGAMTVNVNYSMVGNGLQTSAFGLILYIMEY